MKTRMRIVDFGRDCTRKGLYTRHPRGQSTHTERLHFVFLVDHLKPTIAFRLLSMARRLETGKKTNKKTLLEDRCWRLLPIMLQNKLQPLAWRCRQESQRSDRKTFNQRKGVKMSCFECKTSTHQLKIYYREVEKLGSHQTKSTQQVTESCFAASK